MSRLHDRGTGFLASELGQSCFDSCLSPMCHGGDTATRRGLGFRVLGFSTLQELMHARMHGPSQRGEVRFLGARPICASFGGGESAGVSDSEAAGLTPGR